MSSATTGKSGHETSSAAAAIGHASVDALLVALLVASVAFAGAETHGCLGSFVYVCVDLVVADIGSGSNNRFLRSEPVGMYRLTWLLIDEVF